MTVLLHHLASQLERRHGVDYELARAIRQGADYMWARRHLYLRSQERQKPANDVE